jgi:hypothetical protein
MKQLGLGIIVAIGLTLPAFGQQAVNPEEGVYVLNPAKSTFRGPALKAQMLYVGKDTSTVVGFDANGKPFTPIAWGNTVDGQPHPLTGFPAIDTHTSTQLDPYTVKSVRTKDGKVVQTLIAIYNPDGKTITVTVIGTTPDGVAYNNVLFNEKQ